MVASTSHEADGSPGLDAESPPLDAPPSDAPPSDAPTGGSALAIGQWTDAPGTCPSGTTKVDVTTPSQLASAARGESAYDGDAPATCYFIHNGTYTTTSAGVSAARERTLLGGGRGGVRLGKANLVGVLQGGDGLSNQSRNVGVTPSREGGGGSSRWSLRFATLAPSTARSPTREDGSVARAAWRSDRAAARSAPTRARRSRARDAPRPRPCHPRDAQRANGFAPTGRPGRQRSDQAVWPPVHH